MIGRPPKFEFGLDMPFGEAIERYAGVDPKQLRANIAKSKKKKPLTRKKKAKRASGKSKSHNVILMKDRKASFRRRGLAVR